MMSFLKSNIHNMEDKSDTKSKGTELKKKLQTTTKQITRNHVHFNEFSSQSQDADDGKSFKQVDATCPQRLFSVK